MLTAFFLISSARTKVSLFEHVPSAHAEMYSNPWPHTILWLSVCLSVERRARCEPKGHIVLLPENLLLFFKRDVGFSSLRFLQGCFSVIMYHFHLSNIHSASFKVKESNASVLVLPPHPHFRSILCINTVSSTE